ncbi:hypothetical protein Q2E61_13880 [Microbulbifer thermotolerans]|uniref:hypothetical protein n=1 Tax=Microbulbifer thermotolerans TaxID=252514 RepID=UPI0026722147|nr:hypothetical protein [Microbulbifer thermotolerans]WKT59984.1 hypothetical protein Q2E61_13880 [Microbulbifer thermotolerans]
MYNFLKYLPLEWRLRDDNYCVPQGPSFSSASKIGFTLAGSRLQLRAPRHRPLRKPVKEKRILSSYDVLHEPQLGRYGTKGVMANDYWGGINLLYRRWAFYGPWMTGCKGELSLGISIIGRFDKYAFQNISFFNPKAFEMVLIRYLNDRYGHANWEDELSHVPRYHGPVDWLCHHHLPVFCASFKIYNRGEDPNYLVLPDYLFVFPITEKHFVRVSFWQDIYSFDKNNKPTFDVSPIQELQDSIFNSISLELGPETQAAYDKVKAEVGDMRLSEEFAPLKWPTNVYPPEPVSEMQQRLRAGS